jgi:hypothetical protein
MKVQLNNIHLNTGISSSSECEKVLNETFTSGRGLFELLVLTHMEFQIIPNKSQMIIYAWWKATL